MVIEKFDQEFNPFIINSLERSGVDIKTYRKLGPLIYENTAITDEVQSRISRDAKKFGIITGPSGSGKTSIVKRLVKYNPDIFVQFRSGTDREYRSEEEYAIKYEGQMDDYFRLRPEEFDELEGYSLFFETAKFSGNRYGTILPIIEHAFAKTLSIPLFAVEPNGAKEIYERWKSGKYSFFANRIPVFIYITAESTDILIDRIKKREFEKSHDETAALKIATNRSYSLVNDLQYIQTANFILVNETDKIEETFQQAKKLFLGN